MSRHHLQLIFQDDFRRVLDHFSRLMGVRFCFLTPDGQELQVGENKPHCGFCRMVRGEMGLAEQCEKCDHHGWSLAERSKRSVWYRCHAGLIDGCKELRIGERTIGYMMIGQFRPADAPPSPLLARYRRQFNDDKLRRAYHNLPRYQSDQVEDIMGLFDVLVDTIVAQRLIVVQQLEPIQPLLTWIADHPDRTLSLPEAAQMLDRSVSSVAHLFKQIMGTSFIQYQIDAKLDLADERFRTRRHPVVSQVAAELGFDDPHYFSRLYKKHRGRTPTQFIQLQSPDPRATHNPRA